MKQRFNISIRNLSQGLIYVLLPLILIAFQENLYGAKAKNARDTLFLEYFTGTGCPSCKKIDAYIQKVNSSYDQVVIRTYEVYNDKENFKKMIAAYKKYDIGWDRQWVPVVFFHDMCLIGYTEIQKKLEIEIEKRLNST